MIPIKFLYEVTEPKPTEVGGLHEDVRVVDINRWRKWLVGGHEHIGKLSKDLQIEYGYPISHKETFLFTCEGD